MIDINTSRRQRIRTAFLVLLTCIWLVFPLVGAGRADILDAPTVPDPELSLPGPDEIPLPDPLDEIVGTVEDVLNPAEEEPPPDDGSPTEPSPPPADSDPSTTGDQQDSSTGSSPLVEPPIATENASGIHAPSVIAQNTTPSVTPSNAAPAAVGQASIAYLGTRDPDPITWFRPQGTRSTSRVLELMRALNLPPSTVARILAPFPVAGEASYSDDWGQLRFDPYLHTHEGTDIFAEQGTPVIASADGLIAKMPPMSSVGGISLRLTAADGTYYYYAHLERFARGLSVGAKVAAGQVIGFVGTSGNAEGGLPHLHYEIHPNGGPAVSPVPYLDRWLEEALQATGALKGAPSGGFAGFLSSLPSELKEQAGKFAGHLLGASGGVSTPAGIATWAAIVLGIGGGTVLRRKRRQILLPAEGFLDLS